MRALGIATSIVGILFILACLVVVAISLPDLARYRRLRRM